MISRRPAAPRVALATICGVACIGLHLLAVPLTQSAPAPASRAAAIDTILADPAVTRALVSVRIESLADRRVVYARNAGSLVIPASVMKVITTAVAAERLGWDHRFITRLESSGEIANGTLTGDLIVTGDGDPAINAQDLRGAPVFYDWAGALRSAGIRRVDGRLIVDDDAFDDETLGAGWAWDYLAAGYAAPSSATSYNENVVVVRIAPAETVGRAASIEFGPPGHGLQVLNEVLTTTAPTPATITITRLPGSARVTVRGSIPIGSATIVRTTSVDNPTAFLGDGLRLALAEAGVAISGGAWDIDALPAAPAATGRRLIAERQSPPLSSLIGYALKVSQNFYGDMLLKAIGRSAAGLGSAEAGARAVRETLAAWALPGDALVMLDGSGLSRYSYVSADLLVGVLVHVWNDERLRGPFVAALPVGGHDGTLENRMRNTALDRRIQAKTGTISNVRSLAGYATTSTGEKLAFAIVVNNFTASNAEIDRIAEKVLEEVVR